MNLSSYGNTSADESLATGWVRANLGQKCLRPDDDLLNIETNISMSLNDAMRILDDYGGEKATMIYYKVYAVDPVEHKSVWEGNIFAPNESVAGMKAAVEVNRAGILSDECNIGDLVWKFVHILDY